MVLCAADGVEGGEGNYCPDAGMDGRGGGGRQPQVGGLDLDACLFVTRGPEIANSYMDQQGKERCESKGREKARKAQSREGKNRISVETGIQLF